MTHAYNELYLNDAKNRLAIMFDYAVNFMKEDGDWFAKLFVYSGFAEKFEQGNPSVIAGMSGVEIAREIALFAYKTNITTEANFCEDKSPEYWAGWALAEYQWFTGHSFKDIFARISFSEIVGMYNPYHEMDIRHFIHEMEERYSAIPMETKLKQFRENRGLSQTELAEQSGVNVRSIQMYEQRVNDIDKAQAQTLYQLSKVLGCKIEDLLEFSIKPS